VLWNLGFFKLLEKLFQPGIREQVTVTSFRLIFRASCSAKPKSFPPYPLPRSLASITSNAVEVTRHGRKSVVLVSNERYKELLRQDRRTIRIADMTPSEALFSKIGVAIGSRTARF
jgi:hypothetical protein